MCVFMCVVCMCVGVYVCMCVCVYVCMCVCVYVDMGHPDDLIDIRFYAFFLRIDALISN